MYIYIYAYKNLMHFEQRFPWVIYICDYRYNYVYIYIYIYLYTSI